MRGYTFQGAFDESAWSRGQAWAIYDYVNSARETGKCAYLDLAERLAEYYLRRLEGRQVPRWDFDATGRDAEIKDTAAAAIVASALLELARLHPDAQAAAKWQRHGIAMLEALCRDEFTKGSTGCCITRAIRSRMTSASMARPCSVISSLWRRCAASCIRASCGR
ncbi:MULTISPECIES: hypothetical protein [unclassified Caballeronia]|uniref:hypothetical protein n=1 Tax=unclassified Caballeronia TaxID=2646786 RepID=UPI0028595650|nr:MULTISPECIES: hypothetical protein [unclassified Caballeronia]MDR5815021.1 hypothetical protein [Caballeronia sp. LZ033]MDR5879719.1 hypothetical protein [Caballeronia sp. LZ032]